MRTIRGNANDRPQDQLLRSKEEPVRGPLESLAHASCSTRKITSSRRKPLKAQAPSASLALPTSLTLRYALLILCSLFIVRPVAIWISLWRTEASPITRGFFGWFGPRGLATALFALLVVPQVGDEILDSDPPAEEASQIGFGMSPGDAAIEEPYYYITPWPLPEGATLPDLPEPGRWEHKAFNGPLLLASDLVALDASTQEKALGAFLKCAIDKSLSLLASHG
tara:strand:- start:2298 stop:2969 length:672 start_codon:yes stop_codon:yes gene_type:complete